MSATTEIQWTDATWNPVTGCTEVSPGCDHCYAKTFAERWRGIPGHPYEQGFDLKLWPERLGMPLKWRKPRRVFVNSMSDLFHDGVPDEFIAQVFGVMALARRHTFQVLTKRPGRMASLLARDSFELAVRAEMHRQKWAVAGTDAPGWTWPLPNVWLGTSVESQKWADVRIPKLLETPAAVRFLSCEPLLGPVDLRRWLLDPRESGDGYECQDHGVMDCQQSWPCRGIAWVIIGGESGPGHRPMNPAWARYLRDQTTKRGTAFFFKQVGGRTPKAGGRELDGREWSEFPVVA